MEKVEKVWIIHIGQIIVFQERSHFIRDIGEVDIDKSLMQELLNVIDRRLCKRKSIIFQIALKIFDIKLLLITPILSSNKIDISIDKLPFSRFRAKGRQKIGN